MKKEEKYEVVEALKAQLSSHAGIYITDTSGLSVDKVNAIRRTCFERDIKMVVAKNTLIRKAMEALGDDYTPLHDVLKGGTTILYSNNANAPAKLIKELRKKGDKPVLKGAFVQSSTFIGDNQIDALVNLKSKEELVGEIIGLLQSPAKNVISGLKDSGNKLAGIVKTLSER